ncbi:unnamed protein product [Nesidiocoris tenuis]|uniref:Uncharacterized protein n=1 Tax=Nesidiocoris tenuis TaxID=355587 RepID=A0A6H5HCZ8_9HEMI|nr:unnamed protein product [Nesidiocoris tenuis]
MTHNTEDSPTFVAVPPPIAPSYFRGPFSTRRSRPTKNFHQFKNVGNFLNYRNPSSPNLRISTVLEISAKNEKMWNFFSKKSEFLRQRSFKTNFRPYQIGFRTLIVGADHCWSCGVQLQCPRGLDTQQQQQTLAIRQSRVAERDGTSVAKKTIAGLPETPNFGQWVKPISEFERTGASGSAGYPSATHVLTASASRSASRPVQSFLAIFPPPLGPVSPSPSRSSKLGISSLSRTENVVCGPECPPASLHVLLYLTGRPLVPLALVLAMPAPPSRQICAVFFIDLTGGESGSAGYADNVTCGTGCARIESLEAVESKFYF